MNRIHGVVFALCAAALCATAAEPDRSKPPETPPVPDIRMPGTQQFKLPNGLTVIASQDDRFPLATIELAFLAGSKNDPQDLPGLSDSVAALLNQGTKTRTAKEIAVQAGDLGAQITAKSTPDTLILNGACLSENLPAFLALFADVAQNASFPQEEVALQKQNRLQLLRAQRSDADYVTREALAATAFAGHPYSHIGPNEHFLSVLDQKSLLGFRDSYLVPNNTYLVMVGRLPSIDRLQKMMAEQFGAWARKPLPPQPSAVVPSNKKQLVLVDRPGSVQANIMAAHITPSYGPDYFPMLIGERILGGGASARLFTDIREKHGFAYDAHTETEMMKDAGTATAVTQVRNEVVGPALDALTQDMTAMGQSNVQSVELSEAKASYAGRFILNLERQSGRADELARIQVMNLAPDFLDTYMTHVRSVEPDTIRKTGKYWTPSDATIVVVGDASKIQKSLEKFGEVHVTKLQE